MLRPLSIAEKEVKVMNLINEINMGYDNRVVAFIDILGFKEAVKKSNTDIKEFERIIKTLDELKTFFSSPIKPSPDSDYDTQIIQVSDSLIISRKIQEQGGIFRMLNDCALATHLIIDNGFLCRGAIKYGNTYHKDTMIFGQAYLEAFNAEEKEILPLIKFDKKLFEIVELFPGYANVGHEEWAINFLGEKCKILNSGEYYLDYFTDYDERIGGEEGESSIHYSKLREIIINGLESNDNSAYLKNIWVANQFNKTAQYFGLEKIDI